MGHSVASGLRVWRYTSVSCVFSFCHAHKRTQTVLSV